MGSRRWLHMCTAAMFALSSMAVGGDHGQGKRHGRNDQGQHSGREEDDNQGRHYYSEHDRDEIQAWYHRHNGDNLPPGLAKRDQLPPGLERQLRVRGTLPPGLRKKMAPCPRELEERLPPPPVGYAHVLLGGHIVLVNPRTYLVLDIFHFER